MKQQLRRIFAPLLNCFESGEGAFNYRKSHRTILMVVGLLFLIVAIISGLAALSVAQIGVFIPVVIFTTASFVCLIVSFLGNDRAIATIWGSK